MEAEKDILNYIRGGKLVLPPLCFNLTKRSYRQADLEADVVLETSWERKRYTFVGEIKRYGSDKVVQQAAQQARSVARKLQANPLVIVPWLSTEQLLFLEQYGVSGIDLCGNGLIVVPGQLLVFRSGQPNKFPTSRLIRRVYEGTTSIVGRVLLLKPNYSSVTEILKEIRARWGNTTLSTISKALKQLEEDVIIEKSKQRISLLQPDKLLDRLKTNYEEPRSLSVMRCKLTISNQADVKKVLQTAAEKAKVKLMLSGESSANFYATMAKEPLDIFYCSEFPTAQLKTLGAQVDTESRFPNVELRKTDVETVYFDMQSDKGSNIASPIQTYLELATSDKRGQETAEQIRQQILNNVVKLQQRQSK